MFLSWLWSSSRSNSVVGIIKIFSRRAHCKYSWYFSCLCSEDTCVGWSGQHLSHKQLLQSEQKNNCLCRSFLSSHRGSMQTPCWEIVEAMLEITRNWGAGIKHTKLGQRARTSATHSAYSKKRGPRNNEGQRSERRAAGSNTVAPQPSSGGVKPK